jgi:SAM-dependent methyltransferase
LAKKDKDSRLKNIDSLRENLMGKLNTADGWNERYHDGEKTCQQIVASGTFCHTVSGNRQFYRAKQRSIDRFMSLRGASFGQARVLDAAGGTGTFVDYFLLKQVRQLVVCDFSKAAVESVNKKWHHEPRVHAVTFDLTSPASLPFEKDFDYCFIMEAIFLIMPELAFKQALTNLSNSISPCGILVISDLFPSCRAESEYIVRRTKEEFEVALTDLGFNHFEYFPQTYLFNRHLFGPFQKPIEQCNPLLYWLDTFALSLGLKPPKGCDSDIKYLVAQRKS